MNVNVNEILMRDRVERNVFYLDKRNNPCRELTLAAKFSVLFSNKTVLYHQFRSRETARLLSL